MNSTELIPVFVKLKGGHETLRFVASCRICGKLILDPSKANVAVESGSDGGPSTPSIPILANSEITVSRLPGRAFVFCWKCDQEEEQNHVPWTNAAETFRDRTRGGGR